MKDTLIVMGQDGKTWPTRDMHLSVTQIARGYKPIDGGIYARDGILNCKFLLGMAFALNKRLFYMRIFLPTEGEYFQNMALSWSMSNRVKQ